MTAERFRVLCNVCLVFDSLFLLLYFTTVLHTMSRAISSEPLAKCYQESGSTWHLAVVVALSLSASVALAGIVVHSSVACSGFQHISASKVKSVSSYASSLCVWVLVSSIVQAIAYNQDQCLLLNQEPGAHDFTHIIWQIVYTILWLTWITGNVAASVLARRHKPMLCELQQLGMLTIGSVSTTTPSYLHAGNSGPCRSMPQTVGMPVQQSLTLDEVDRMTEPAAGVAVPSRGGVPQVGSPGVVQGTPVSSVSQ